jgi:3D (Asp-Asp-Asp) domain-containing protein
MDSTTAGKHSGTILWMALVLLAWALPAAAQSSDLACEPRVMRVTFYTCGEGSSRCLTRRGNNPIPFRTVAVGDRALLGSWIYVEDLGGWVHASDTGQGLKPGWMDVFVGEARMVTHARRLGVQYWTVRVCRSKAAAPETGGAAIARTVPAREEVKAE